MSIFKRHTAIVPAPPPGPAPWNFDLIVQPPCVATVTVEGLPGGPVMTNADGYVYVQGLPGYLHDGMIMVVAEGYKPLYQASVWPDLVHTNAVGGHNYLHPLIQEWPVAPDRLTVLSARTPFQGCYADTQQFGRIPMFGPETSSLNDDDLTAYVKQAMASVDDQGRTFDALEMAISWNYDESPQYAYPVPGRDFSQNLPEIRSRIKRMIEIGAPLGLHAINLYCAADGESIRSMSGDFAYNDPRGWTYGREWFMVNFQRIYDSLGPLLSDPVDLRTWIVFLPCYDGGDAYQWKTGQNVADVWKLMRRVVDAGGTGYVGFEWPAGQVHLGDDFPTWTQENAGCVDVHHLELPPGPYPLAHGTDGYNQINAQLGRFHRIFHPPFDFQPNVDDRWPFPYEPLVTSRGPQIVQVREFDTYPWVRGMSVEQVNRDRRWIRDGVPGAIIC